MNAPDNSRSSRRALIAILGSFLIFMANAFAQERAGIAEVERVIVTGSNIPTAEETGPNPVDTYRPADIEKLGIRNAQDLQTFLPQEAGGTVNLNIGNGGDGTVQLNLRGFLPKETLVLVDGKRVAFGSLGVAGVSQGVDINLIPFPMIDHIDILKDGASATGASYRSYFSVQTRRLRTRLRTRQLLRFTKARLPLIRTHIQALPVSSAHMLSNTFRSSALTTKAVAITSSITSRLSPRRFLRLIAKLITAPSRAMCVTNTSHCLPTLNLSARFSIHPSRLCHLHPTRSRFQALTSVLVPPASVCQSLIRLIRSRSQMRRFQTSFLTEAVFR